MAVAIGVGVQGDKFSLRKESEAEASKERQCIAREAFQFLTGQAYLMPPLAP